MKFEFDVKADEVPRARGRYVPLLERMLAERHKNLMIELESEKAAKAACGALKEAARKRGLTDKLRVRISGNRCIVERKDGKLT